MTTEIWNLEDHVIEGTYHGVPFRGRVVESRPCYGAAVAIQHTVELEEPVTVYGLSRQIILLKSSDDAEISEYRVIE